MRIEKRIEIARWVALYYKEIPGMLRLLRQERDELEEEYNGLRGVAADGMPRGASPGDPTQAMGLRAAENGVGDRLRKIGELEKLLMADEESIRACMDAVSGRYKQIIQMRYVRGYSWAKISAKTGAPDSTVRNWNAKAMERFGEALEELPNAGEIIRHASRART